MENEHEISLRLLHSTFESLTAALWLSITHHALLSPIKRCVSSQAAPGSQYFPHHPIFHAFPDTGLRTGAACSLLHSPPKGKHFPWSGELTATWKHFEKLVHFY